LLGLDRAHSRVAKVLELHPDFSLHPPSGLSQGFLMPLQPKPGKLEEGTDPGMNLALKKAIKAEIFLAKRDKHIT